MRGISSKELEESKSVWTRTQVRPSLGHYRQVSRVYIVKGVHRGNDVIVVQYDDEPPHQILLYTLLFLLFHYFLYIADLPLCTPTDVTAHDMMQSHAFAPAHTQHSPLLHWTSLTYLMVC